LAFNFFFTKPYLTLRVNSAKDILTVVLILGVGLAVGELGVARSRQSATRRSHLRSVRALEQVGAQVTAGADADAVWPSVRDALVVSLGLSSARFEAGAPTLDLPVMERDGRVDVRDKRYIGDGFELPALGVMINVEADGRHLGQIVLEPGAGVGVTREQRRAAVALADQFALAVRRSPQVRSLV
jgi:K+-sensing histidine kinase KdpD